MSKYWTLQVELAGVNQETFQEVCGQLGEKLGRNLNDDPHGHTELRMDGNSGEIMLDLWAGYDFPQEVRNYAVWKWCDERAIYYEVTFLITEVHEVEDEGFHSTKKAAKRKDGHGACHEPEDISENRYLSGCHKLWEELDMAPCDIKTKSDHIID